MIKLKNRILFLIYKTLILDYGPHSVREIFEKVTFELDGKFLPPEELYTRLYSNTLPPMPMEKGMQVYNHVTSYVEERGSSLEEFIKSLAEKRTNSFLLSSAKEMLQALEPYFFELYSLNDPRLFILKRANEIHSLNLTNTHMEMIHLQENPNKSSAFVEIFYSYDEYYKYAYRVDIWKNFVIRECPRCFNAPPYDSVKTVGDCRKVEDILNAQLETVDTTVYCASEPIGILEKYSDFLQSLKIPPRNAKGNIDVVGIRALCDFQTPSGKIEKGHFYGAPSYLLNLTFTPIHVDTTRVLKQLITDSTVFPDTEGDEFEERHNALIQSITKEVEVVFNREQQKILINGELFGRGIPAHLLYYLSNEHLKGRTTPFKYQELILEPYFKEILDPITPNLHVRVSRLKQKLEEKSPNFEIILHGGGKFSFQAKTPFALVAI